MILDIDTWLHEIGLAQYAEGFRSNDIDATLLRLLTGDDLKELGVSSLGHRKKLLEAIEAIGAAPAALSAKPVRVGANTSWPAACKRGITRRQHQAPCQAPCTSTIGGLLPLAMGVALV